MFSQSRQFINQVPMVESQQANPVKKRINLPATIFNRPHDLENKSILSNRQLTPSRKPIGGTVSPSKARPNKSLKSSCFPVRKQATCENHEGKVARFLVVSQEQRIPYCEKCSILLASQGFKLIKIDRQEQDPLDSMQQGQRKNQIICFIDNLDKISRDLQASKGKIQDTLKFSRDSYQRNVGVVDQYYQLLIESIQKHKVETCDILRQHYFESQQEAKEGLDVVARCAVDCKGMRQDIISSIELIREAQQKQFRPVMNAYSHKVKEFKECIGQAQQIQCQQHNLAFGDVDDTGKRIVQLIQIGFQNEENPSGKPNPYFSFQQNGVECTGAEMYSSVIQEEEDQRSPQDAKMQQHGRSPFQNEIQDIQEYQ